MESTDVDPISALGIKVSELILWGAGLLREDQAPGLVVIVLITALAGFSISFYKVTRKRVNSLDWISDIVSEPEEASKFSQSIGELDRKIHEGAASPTRSGVSKLWSEYRETLIPFDAGDGVMFRNSVRPSVFFNIEDLHFGAGFWKILPGLFVTVGLFLTFLGLISALGTMGEDMQSSGEVSQDAMTNLLSVASAKFIMSLTGLFCSILFTIQLRIGMGKVETAIHRLNVILERQLTFISLEEIGVSQLEAIKEQKEHFKTIGMELVAELGRPLREELPRTISDSISGAMNPLIERVGKMSSDGVGDMVSDLSSRFSADVGTALATASQKLNEAGDQLERVVKSMAQSSGNMGVEMEQAMKRLGESVGDLKITMAAGAKETSDAFSKGSEAVLTSMNTTLASIEKNTGEGANAIREAAAEMSLAAKEISKELEAASKRGAAAAEATISDAANRAGESINDAGVSVLDAFTRANSEIGRIAQEMTETSADRLLRPVSDIAGLMEDLVKRLGEASDKIRVAAVGMQSGADANMEAASSFRGSARELTQASAPISATIDRLESSTRKLVDSTENISSIAKRSAEVAANSLATAEALIGGEQRSIQATLLLLQQSIDQMKGQGDRFDEIDQQLGAAFEQFTTHVSNAVEGLYGHVREVQERLSPALDTMREIVEQAEQFAPESRRRQ
jgi:methyl-accepting chemotaxis protein